MSGLRSLLHRREADALRQADDLAGSYKGGDIGTLARMETALDEADRAHRLAIRVKHEPLTYSPDGPHSFFRDVLAADHKYGRNDKAAQERLQRNAIEVSIERRDLTRVDGAGGEFVFPVWLLELLGRPARSNRPFADAIGSLPLPPGADNLPVPTVIASGATAPQSADNGAVANLSPSTSSASMPVRTITGQIPASLQLIDQTPPAAFDAIYAGELLDDYDAALETQLWNGSGASGQLLGVLNVSGVTSVP